MAGVVAVPLLSIVFISSRAGMPKRAMAGLEAFFFLGFSAAILRVGRRVALARELEFDFSNRLQTMLHDEFLLRGPYPGDHLDGRRRGEMYEWMRGPLADSLHLPRSAAAARRAYAARRLVRGRARRVRGGGALRWRALRWVRGRPDGERDAPADLRRRAVQLTVSGVLTGPRGRARRAGGTCAHGLVVRRRCRAPASRDFDGLAVTDPWLPVKWPRRTRTAWRW